MRTLCDPRCFGAPVMITKRIAALAVTVGVLAAQATVFVTSAQAYDNGWRRGGGHHRPYAGYGAGYGRHHYAPPVRHKRDRSGDAVGAAILGIGALIIGAAIADGARKQRYYDHD